MARLGTNDRWLRLYPCPNPCYRRTCEAADIHILNDGRNTCLFLCGLLDPALKACVRIHGANVRYVVYTADTETGRRLEDDSC